MDTIGTTDAVKFRENATTAVTRDGNGIAVWVRGIAAPIRVTYAALHDAIRAEAMGYGMEVRLTRAAAMERDAKSGKPATAQAKWEAINRLAAHYMTGTDAWTMASGGGGGGLGADTKALIEALVRAFGLDSDVAEEQVRAMSQATRDALRMEPEVKPVLDAIYAERAAAVGTYERGLVDKLKALKKG